MEILDGRPCQLGEAPYYDERSHRIGWVDVLGQAVHWRDVQTGEVGTLSTPERIGAAIPRVGGGLVLCLADGPVLADRDGTVSVLGTFAEADAAAGVVYLAGRGNVRGNDAKPDPAGRLWLGTLSGTPGDAALYRLDPGHSVAARVLDGVTVSNGLGWSPDAATMYYADTATHRVDAFDFDVKTGNIANRHQFTTVSNGGTPDGLCVDAAGGIWVACWGAGCVRRYRPDGTLEREVEVPTPQVTSCAFVGPELDQLVITTAAVRESEGQPGAGLTYVHRPDGIVGQPVAYFAG